MKFPIPSDWDGESWCRWAVCWPESEQWEGLLRGLLTLPQRGRTWDEKTGVITDIQEVGREISAFNLPLNGVIMACNDTEMIAAFNAIASAIRYAADKDFSKACCEGGFGQSGIVGVVIQPVGGNEIPIYGTQPTAELPDGATFPQGFEDVGEWNTHKCSVANVIFDGVISTLQGLATLNLLNVNVLGVLALAAISGFLAFPPAAIPVMVGALIALVASQALLIAAKNYLIENRDEWVCMLYEAESVNQLIGILADAMDTLLAFIGTSGPVGAAIKLVLMLLFNGDALNQLFDSNADYQYPDADCSGCEPGWVFSVLPSGQESGNLVSGSMDADSEVFVASAVLEVAPDPCPGTYLLVVSPPLPGRVASITLEAGTLSDAPCGVDWQWTEQATGTTWDTNNGTFDFDTFIDGRMFTYFAARSALPFSLEFVIDI
jgi:hypothetical protein